MLVVFILMFKDIEDPISAVSKLENLYIISVFQLPTLKDYSRNSLKSDDTSQDERNELKKQYLDLLNNNDIMQL